MELAKSKNCFFLKDLFLPSVTAGFTTQSIEGNLPQDIEKIPVLKKSGLRLSYLKQIHSAKIHFVKDEGMLQGDGLLTRKDNLALIVRTADCLPLFFSSEEKNTIGIIHMGWRGAQQGILDNLDFDLSLFKVAAGVGLRQCCYGVGDEFLKYPNFKNFIERRDNQLYFNPINFAKNTLIKRGLKEDNFFDANICSFCSNDFFSFRRNKTTLRTLSFIVKQ